MQADEIGAFLEHLDATWAPPKDQEQAAAEAEAWARDLARFDNLEAFDTLDFLRDHERFRPNWPTFRAQHRALFPSRYKQPDCDCDGGWAWVGKGHDRVIPCEKCNGERNERWTAGEYAPAVHHKREEHSVGDVMHAQAALASMRELLAGARTNRRTSRRAAAAYSERETRA